MNAFRARLALDASLFEDEVGTRLMPATFDPNPTLSFSVVGGPLFADGFEAGSLSAWAASVP
jgi:hypothetical protein